MFRSRIRVAAGNGHENGCARVTIDSIAIRIGERVLWQIGPDVLAFATILRIAIGVEIPGQTCSELACAHRATHVGIDHRRGTILIAGAAVQRIGGRIDFATIHRHVVAIREARIAHAHGARPRIATRRRIGKSAHVPARPAIVHVGGRIDLAAGGHIHVTIAISSIARTNRAGAIDARFRGIGEIADVITRSAIVHVCLRIRFATIGVLSVAIFKWRHARGNQTKARSADLGCIGQIAHRVASAAIVHARRRVDFATVGTDSIAIAEAYVTCCHLASTVRAYGRGIG